MRKIVVRLFIAILCLTQIAPLYAQQLILAYKDFNKLMQENPFPLGEEPVPFTMSRRFNGEGHVLIGCVVKGRQPGCIPGVNEIFKEFAGEKFSSFRGRLTFFLANPGTVVASNPDTQNEANASFASTSEQSDEKARADELKRLLKDVSLFIEVSQNVAISEDLPNSERRPYFSFPFSELTYLWARALRASDTVISTNSPENANNALLMTDYARKSGIPSLSLELNQKDSSPEAAAESLENLKTTVGAAMQAITNVTNPSSVAEMSAYLGRVGLPELRNFYSVKHTESFSAPSLKLRENLKNFQVVKAGDVLGTNTENNEPIKAATEGLLLNPKYIKPHPVAAEGEKQTPPRLPRALYQILQPTSLKILLDSSR